MTYWKYYLISFTYILERRKRTLYVVGLPLGLDARAPLLVTTLLSKIKKVSCRKKVPTSSSLPSEISKVCIVLAPDRLG